MRVRILGIAALAVVVCGAGAPLPAVAETGMPPVTPNKVRTETFRPPAAQQAPQTPAAPSAPAPRPDARVAPPAPGTAPEPPEVITDVSRLPAPVAHMRERILEAARSGDLDKVVAVMRANPAMPIFSFSEDKDPAAFWRANYPDSGGIEALSILVTILETGFVHVDAGTAQEAYVWPYFARTPLKTLSPPQKVELFRIVTAYDYKEMADFGAYVFYRLGISPDGTWQFFVSGD